MSKGLPVVDYDLCMACGICVQFCPFSCLELSKMGVDGLKKAYPALVEGHKCTGCAICAERCPEDCIEIRV